MCLCAVELAQDLGVGLKLGREDRAEARHCGCWVGLVGVGGFVVDDPPDRGALRERSGSGAKDAVDLHSAQRAGENADPAGFRRIVSVGREDPLAVGLGGAGESETECFRGEAHRLLRLDAGGADLGGDAGLELLERGASGGPVAGGAVAGELLEEDVNGGSQGAGD